MQYPLPDDLHSLSVLRWTRNANVIEVCRCKLLHLEDRSSNGQLAAVSVRLLLDLEPLRGAVRIEKELVRLHMRVVVSIPRHQHYMYTGTPSEPIVAEATARLMFEGFNMNPRYENLTSRNSRRTTLDLLDSWVHDGVLEKKGSR
jgi:hypothetical protein